MRLPKLSTSTILIGLGLFALSKRKKPAPTPAPAAPTPSLQVPKTGAAVWTFAQLRELARAAGLPADQLDTAAAIALAESSGHPDALGDQGHSFGLWQINVPAHPEYAPGPQLFDPSPNAIAMASISRLGTYWTPWSTWKDGSFQKYMPTPVAAGEPVAQLEPPATAPPASPVSEPVVDEDLEPAPAVDVEAEVVDEAAAPAEPGRRRRVRT